MSELNITNVEDKGALGEYDLVYENESVLFFTPTTKREYQNSIPDRTRLLADCTQYNRMDLYTAVMSVWGDTPTVEDPNTPKTLEQIKEEKLEELVNAFNARVKGSFTTTEGYTMQFDIDDSLKMFGAIQLLEGNNIEEGYITDANDETHYNIPVSVMKSIQMQMLNKYEICHLLKQQYRAAIGAADSIEAVEDIEISFNRAE